MNRNKPTKRIENPLPATKTKTKTKTQELSLSGNQMDPQTGRLLTEWLKVPAHARSISNDWKGHEGLLCSP